METEILCISSDSEDTIIESKDLQSKIKPQRDEDLDYLFNKYLGDRNRKETDEKTSDFEECITENLNEFDSTSSKENHLNFSFDDRDLPGSSNMKKFKFADSELSHEIPSKQKLEKEKLRQEKLKLKEQKKGEEKRNKALKDALNNHYRNMKPENCIKFVKVEIDERLENENFTKHIIKELQNNQISYVMKYQELPSIITWKRLLDSHILDDNGQLIDTSKGCGTDEVLLVVKWNDFLIRVHNESFTSFIEDFCAKLVGKRIILAIIGLEQYYQYQKRQKNREFKQSVSNNPTKKYTDQKVFGDVPLVSRRTVEYALTEIQMIHSISHKMVETDQDLASFVYQVTKSIAQAPYKKEKQEKFIQARWFMSEDNRNCIKVDKNGNGLLRLWKQVISTFPLASLETAEAITAVYPTPSSLFQAYENVEDGEKLLQDIPIRRSAGPITTMRKIGPELSKKIHNCFTSIDPEKFL